MTYDVLIRNARVIDGTGAPPAAADVGIRDGRIEEVGDLRAADAGQVVDARGEVVCPGFVDVHTHSDWAPFLPEEHAPLRLANVLQGVTTEVPGNCGSSPFPYLPHQIEQQRARLGRVFGGAAGAFTTLCGYRDALAQAHMLLNFAPLVGHGTIRIAAMGLDDRAPTPDELATMERLTEQAMEDGAFGLSTGMALVPGIYAQSEEVDALARIAGRHGRRYASHMRDEGDHIEDSVAETMRVGRDAGAGVQISHHKVGPQRNWGKSRLTLPMIESARGAGQDVAIDVYPYDATSNGLTAILPRWFQDQSTGSARQKLADEHQRARLISELGGDAPTDRWGRVRVAAFREDASYEGLTIEEIASLRGTSSPEAVADLVAADVSTMIITKGMDLDEVRTIGAQRYAMVGSDGVPIPGKPHPRLTGSFATVLQQNARDESLLADAVRRMTSFPCERFRIPERGVVRRGYIADLVVLDPSRVAPGSTYTDPFVAPSGVKHVLVGGTFVVRDGQPTDARPGQVLEPA